MKSGHLTKLPTSWTLEPLARLGTWTGGGTPSTSNAAFWAGGTIPWVSPKDMKQARVSTAQDLITEKAVASSATNLIVENSVLLVTRSGILRHSLPAAINTKPVTLNQDMKALTPLKGLNVEFLYYGFRRFERDILHTCCKGGTTVQSIEAPRLTTFEFPVPPAAEQQRIVTKIEELFSELDKGIENLKLARAQLAAYRLSLLKHAFEGKLTADWRAAQADPLETAEQLKSSNFVAMRTKDATSLPTLPSSWAYTYLANLGDLNRGKSKHRPRNDPFLFGGPYPFIQTGEVKAAGKVIRTFENTYSEAGLRQSTLWPKGTLCITIAANIAQTAFLGFDACFPDSVVGFKAYEGIVEPEFIDFFIRGVRTRIEAYAPATAQKNINLTTLENLVVPLAPLAEQKKLIENLSEQLSMLDQTEAEIDTNLQKSEALRQSILKQAFSGQLVPQHPNDEPAAELLARIRAHRAVVEPRPIRRKRASA